MQTITKYSATIHQPGCLPDAEPVVFATGREAWDYLSEEFDRWVEETIDEWGDPTVALHVPGSFTTKWNHDASGSVLVTESDGRAWFFGVDEVQVHPSGLEHGERGHSCNGAWNRQGDHPLVGQTLPYRGELSGEPATDSEPGVLVIAAGMRVQVLSVFDDWNCVPGLRLLYVHVPDTGMFTHVTPADLGVE